MKGVLTLLCLLVTCAAVVFCNGKIQKTRIPHVSKRYFGVTLALLILGLTVAWGINVPRLLQPSHPDVVLHKELARESCHQALENMDIISAENHIRNNTVGLQLAKTFNAQARQSLDRSLRRLNNLVFFRVGVLTAVLPFLPLLAGAAAASHLDQAGSSLPPAVRQLVSLAPAPHSPLWESLLPCINAVTGMAVVAYCGFYLWLEERQVTSCLLISGHWYTYALTTVACVLCLVLLSTHAASQTQAPTHVHLWYGAWCAAYQALSWRVLKSSQMFYHDDTEARAGLLGALTVLPLMLLAGDLAAFPTLGSSNGSNTKDSSSTDGSTVKSGENANVRPSSEPAASGPPATTKNEVPGTTTTSKLVSPSPPPPPPPPPVQGSIPTPPVKPSPSTVQKKNPPPNKASGPDPRDDFLNQIRKGVTLKHVSDSSQSEPSAPTDSQKALNDLKPLDSSGGVPGHEEEGGLVGGIMSELAKRRQFIRQESTKSDSGWESDE